MKHFTRLLRAIPAQQIFIPLFLACLTFGGVQAQIADSSAAPWEIGLQLNNIQYQNIDLFHPESASENKARSFHIQAFAIHTLPRNRFLRGALGLNWSKNEVKNLRFDMLPTMTVAANSADLTAGFAYGYQFPQSPKPILNRLRMRVGLNLELGMLLGQSYLQTYYQYDSAGVATLHRNTSDHVNYFNMSPQGLFQFEVRVLAGLHLGLEWRYGPSFSMRKSLDSDYAQGSSTRRFTNLSWSTNFYTPTFSIGYSF